uniref:Uncharacterized protein n=1 Tax=Klebsiella pneumoniae TaxID=573 RepID=A0A8B0SSU9_KLEPN|nr:hypothetical protein [Klebsiella pneumoniae]
MSDSKINEMQGNSPFSRKMENLLQYWFPPVAMNNFPLANPEED